MSDSDSPLSDAPAPPSIPSDARIAGALRDVVDNAFRNDDLDSLTLKRVRATVTDQLGLPDGFLKTDSKWGDKSKQIVTEEVAKQDATPSEPASSPVKEAKSPAKSKKPEERGPDKSKNKTVPAQKKRKETDSAPARHTAKRQKTTLSDSDDDDGGNSSSSEDYKNNGKAAATKDPQPDSSHAQATPQKENTSSRPVSKSDDNLGPDSDLSDVLDDSPPAKVKRQKRDRSPKPSKKTSSKATAKPKAKTKPEKTTTPQDDEVKRLQAQLGKCGIRKLWGKELAKFDTPRDKITHLRGLLKDVGMDGRFSEEKARQIREERELRADLEAIQEGEQMWGTKADDAPRRRLAKGLQELQGLGDDEESD